ncbi:MAG: Ni/Fe-hydrogenase cytochrome b subunit [Candidatus Deferrimicrobiaceae bacterium]
MTHRAQPIGGPILTKPFKILFAAVLVSVPIIGWRFASGLGSTTGLSDGYAWGIWIAYDVVAGTGLACGGYAIALLCYVLNQGKYHPLVRPAILTSALGYTMAGFAIVVDVGRYWNLWKVPLLWNWNRNSVLLEVAICVMAYIIVLWIELSPVFLEVLEENDSFPRLGKIAVVIRPWLDKVMLWILALGILLPTMHQSSLGALMLIATSKLHKLWHTPLLPLLFLTSCLLMGYSMVVFESALSTRSFGRPRETKMLVSLSKIMAVVSILYIVLRLYDLALQGRLGLIFAMDRYSLFFLLEMALFLAPALLLLKRERRYNPGYEFVAAMMMITAGTLYRFDTYLIAFNPGPGWSYFPTIPEMLVTFGMIAFELMLFLIIVKRFPIFAGIVPAASSPGGGDVAHAPAAGR